MGLTQCNSYISGTEDNDMVAAKTSQIGQVEEVCEFLEGIYWTT